MTVLGALGWLGALALLLGYVQVSRGRQAGDGAAFATLNVIGSAGLGLAAAGGRVWSSAALNATWVLVGVVTLIRVNRRQRPRRLHLTPSGVSRTSAPAAMSRSRIRSATAKSRAARAPARSSRTSSR